ncbi:LysR family transcriptional regulator [Paenibacillus jamilae]|uniref:LysR family transcriptional regulator n=1 Tax=Paenibacillus jamilae TaxID=114136 RepID=A0ACC4ZTP3_9BACL|nr:MULTISPECIES: LysR family transcriptional regulator [Paenibacillus]AUO06307.1 LysR family transcriptional regulator [Paenibacillus sp. lzh-N1]KTS81648.1 LysR family transcriptional regulator [Paenibacillus jamilae]
MELRHLKYFLAIADAGQITAAAKKLQIAQPPLSQQLMQLEEELGVKLVHRGSRSIQLTEAGIILRNRAKQILELTDATTREINDFAMGMKGTLTIGTVSSSGATLMKDRLSEFHKTYAGVKFEIHEGNTFRILDLLNKGIVEVGIVRTPFNTAGLGCRYASTEPMIAVMTEEYDWNPEQKTISLAELKNRPLIIYRRFEQLIHDTCMKHGFEPNIFCKNDDARTTLHWANEGLGIGMISRSALSLGSNNHLIVKEISYEELHTRVAAVWLKDKYMSSLASRFIESFSQASSAADLQ